MNTTKRHETDWNGMRARLQEAEARIGQAFTPSGDETRRILQERAVALAAMPQSEAEGDGIDVVELALAHEIYAIESAYVREIYPLTDLTPLPCTPPFVLGIVNIHGQIVSVIDIRQFFDLPVKELTNLDKVIVLQSGEMTFGILADAILGIRRLPLADIQPSLPTLIGIRERYLKGITRNRKVVLDAAKLIHDEGLVVREQVDR